MVVPGTNGYDYKDSESGYKAKNTPFGTNDEIIFEGLNQKYRVFIAGYDVTPDVSNLTISQKVDGEISCTFSLENTKNKYVITKEDLEINIPKIVENKSIRESSSKNFNTSASSDRVTLNSTLNLRTDQDDGIISSDGVGVTVGGRKVINHEINDVYNRRSYYWKSATDSTPTSLNPQLMLKHMLFMVKWLSNIEKGEGECVFDYKDPVVVFVQGRFSTMWYFGFSGGLRDYTIGFDYGGSQNINVNCVSRKYFLSKSTEVNSAVGKNFNLEAKNIDLRINRSMNIALKDVFTTKYLKDLFTTMFLKVSKPKTTSGTFLDLPAVPINYVDNSWLLFMEYYLSSTTNMNKYASSEDPGKLSDQQSVKDTPDIIRLKKEISDQEKLIDDVRSDYELVLKREKELKIKVDQSRGNKGTLGEADILKQQYARAVKNTKIALEVYETEKGKLEILKQQLELARTEVVKKSLERSVAQYLSDAISQLYQLLNNLFNGSSISSDPELKGSSIKDGSTVEGWMFYNDVDTVKFYKKYKENLINPASLNRNTKKTPGNTASDIVSQHRIVDWSNPLNTNYSATVTDNIYQVSVFTVKPYTTRNVSSILESNTARVWESDFCFSEDTNYLTIDGVDTNGEPKKYYQFNWKSKYSAGVIGIHPAVNEDFINKFHILPQIFGLAVDNDRTVEIKEKQVLIDNSPISRTISQLSVSPEDQTGTSDTQFFPPDYTPGVIIQGYIADKLVEVFEEINERIENSEGKLKIKSIVVEAHADTQNDKIASYGPDGKPNSYITVLYDPSAFNASQKYKYTEKLAKNVISFYRSDRRFTSGKYKYEAEITSKFANALPSWYGFFRPASLTGTVDAAKIEEYYANDRARINSGKIKKDRTPVNAPLLRMANVHPEFPDEGVNFSKLRNGSPEDRRKEKAYRTLLIESRKKIRANRRVVIRVEFDPISEKDQKGGVRVNKIRNAVRTPYEKLKEQVFGVPTDVDPKVDGVNFHRPRFIVMLPPIYATDVTVTGLNFREFNVFNAQHINLKQVIDEFIKSIQFKYFETPVGDVILEPINYDFSPWDQVPSYGKYYGKYSSSGEADVPLDSFVEQPSGTEMKSVTILPPYITTYVQPKNLELVTLPIVKPKNNFRHPYYFNNMNEKNFTHRFKPDNIFTSITVLGLPPGSTGAAATAAANTIVETSGEFYQDLSKIAYAGVQPLGSKTTNNVSPAYPTATYVADGFEETVRSLDIDFKIASQILVISSAVQGMVIDIYKNDSEALISKLKAYQVSGSVLRPFQPTLDGLIKNIVWPILYPEIREKRLAESKASKTPNKKAFDLWLKNNGKSASDINNAKIKKNVYDTILAELSMTRSPYTFPVYEFKLGSKTSTEYIYDYPLFKKEHINPKDGVTILPEVRLPYLKGFKNVVGKLFLSLKRPQLKKGANSDDVKNHAEAVKEFDTTVKDNLLTSVDDKMANEFLPKLMKLVFISTPAGKREVEKLKNIYPKPKDPKGSSNNKGGDSKAVSYEPKITTFADFALARAKGEYNPQADFVTLYGIKPYTPIKIPYLRTAIDCKLYAIALFNQLYNNAFEYSYTSMPLTPELLVNRTGYFESFNMLGLINSLNHSMSQGDGHSTSVDISYPRRNILQSNYSIIDYDFDKAPQSDYINASPYVAGSTEKFNNIKDPGLLASYSVSNFSIFRKLGALYEVTQVGEGKLSLQTEEDYKNIKNEKDKINTILSNLTDRFKYYYTRFNTASIEVTNKGLQYDRASNELLRIGDEILAAPSESKLYWQNQQKKMEKIRDEALRDLQVSIDGLQYLTSLLFGFAFKERDTKPESVNSTGLNVFANRVLTAYPYLPDPVTAVRLMYKEHQKEKIRIGGNSFDFVKLDSFDYEDSNMNKLCLKRNYTNNKLVDTSTVQPLLICLAESIDIKSKIEENSKTVRSK